MKGTLFMLPIGAHVLLPKQATGKAECRVSGYRVRQPWKVLKPTLVECPFLSPMLAPRIYTARGAPALGHFQESLDHTLPLHLLSLDVMLPLPPLPCLLPLAGNEVLPLPWFRYFLRPGKQA